ncbi:unnamed protein product [Protopolystoma xenopodis]|uniref:Uncharacterized protein n=1 Tax=Protopolystoma xenopodis TaxID=117903 RepID=A0A448WMH8_9PLAT|nr:unnamed protein product [Protopolystoma xenopodis]
MPHSTNAISMQSTERVPEASLAEASDTMEVKRQDRVNLRATRSPDRLAEELISSRTTLEHCLKSHSKVNKENKLLNAYIKIINLLKE